jgi:hypothetical protein
LRNEDWEFAEAPIDTNTIDDVLCAIAPMLVDIEDRYPANQPLMRSTTAANISPLKAQNPPLRE